MLLAPLSTAANIHQNICCVRLKVRDGKFDDFVTLDDCSWRSHTLDDDLRFDINKNVIFRSFYATKTTRKPREGLGLPGITRLALRQDAGTSSNDPPRTNPIPAYKGFPLLNQGLPSSGAPS